jgi:Helicase associated domain
METSATTPSTMEANAPTPSTMEANAPITADSDPSPARTTYDLKWEEAYQRLRTFYQQNRHTNISYRYKEDPTLGRWGA